MTIEFDSGKDAANIEKHGISLERASDIIIMAFVEDNRSDYGETRVRAFGTIDGIYHCLVYTVRGEHIRAISLRRAHSKEMKRYAFQSRPGLQ